MLFPLKYTTSYAYSRVIEHEIQHANIQSRKLKQNFLTYLKPIYTFTLLLRQISTFISHLTTVLMKYYSCLFCFLFFQTAAHVKDAILFYSPYSILIGQMAAGYKKAISHDAHARVSENLSNICVPL